MAKRAVKKSKSQTRVLFSVAAGRRQPRNEGSPRRQRLQGSPKMNNAGLPVLPVHHLDRRLQIYYKEKSRIPAAIDDEIAGISSGSRKPRARSSDPGYPLLVSVRSARSSRCPA